MVDKSKMMNLDDLDNAPNTVEKEELPMGVGGVPVAQKRQGVQDIFDRHKKMLFLFDISGSMGDGMAPDEIEQMYHWSDTILDKFLEVMRKDMPQAFMRRYIGAWAKPTDAEIEAKMDEELKNLHLRNLQMEVDDENKDDEELEKDAADIVKHLDPDEKADTIFFLTYGIAPVKDLNLKLYINRCALADQYGIKLVRTGVQPKHISKMDVMRKAADTFINDRFTKVPDAQVMAFTFDDYCELLTRDVTKEGLLQATNAMYPRGGTDIYAAVATALREFKRAPSPLALHHIVLVTDAETGEGTRIEKDFLNTMKTDGVVLDFIQIVGALTWNDQFKDSVEALKRLCTATGGEYTQVLTPSDFTQKFLKAANRLMLPAKI